MLCQSPTLLQYPQFALFSAKLEPKPLERARNDTEDGEDASAPPKFSKPNIFSNFKKVMMSGSSEMNEDDYRFQASNNGLNVGLAAFYSLPKLEKKEADAILQELRTDMDD